MSLNQLEIDHGKHSKNFVELPDGQQYVAKSRQAKMCIEAAMAKSTLEALQQKLTDFYKENPYRSGSFVARTVISQVNGGIRQNGYRIECPFRKTNEGKIEHPLDLVKTLTSSLVPQFPKA